MTKNKQFDAPICAPTICVKSDWIDLNGHMNMAFYLLVFDQAIDHVWQEIGLGARYLEETNASTFTLQSQIQYAQEVMVDDPLRIEFQLLGYDQKRIHCFQRMFHAERDYLAATEERMTVHVNMAKRKSAPLPKFIEGTLEQILEKHKALAKDDRVGRPFTLRK